MTFKTSRPQFLGPPQPAPEYSIHPSKGGLSSFWITRRFSRGHTNHQSVTTDLFPGRCESTAGKAGPTRFGAHVDQHLDEVADAFSRDPDFLQRRGRPAIALLPRGPIDIFLGNGAARIEGVDLVVFDPKTITGGGRLNKRNVERQPPGLGKVPPLGQNLDLITLSITVVNSSVNARASWSIVRVTVSAQLGTLRGVVFDCLVGPTPGMEIARILTPTVD
jgi:hypothetical protein